MPKFQDLKGMRFDRILVLDMKPREKGVPVEWLCLCNCGTEKTISSGPLLSGRTRSCGCLSRENTILRNTTHGHAGKVVARSYNTWAGMIDRCRNPKNKKYKDYGGRGITVSNEWMDYGRFIEDMGPSPAKGYSLDRIDVNGNYTKENCRWATPLEQASNRRNNVIVHSPDGDMCASVAARFYGISGAILLKRIHQGWDHYEAIFTPVGKQGAHIKSRVGKHAEK